MFIWDKLKKVSHLRPRSMGSVAHFFKSFFLKKSTLFASGFIIFFLTTSYLFWFFEHSHPEQKELLETPLDVFYWWMVTCTTVGYGDISPKTPEGRFLVIIVITFGVAMVTTVVARIGSKFLEHRLQSMRGLIPMENLKNHIIVCGWQDELANILKAILDIDPGRNPNEIVLVNSMETDKVNALQMRKEFVGLKFVAGDYTDRTILEKAGVENSSSVMILAETEDAAPDSKTLLAVMAARQISKTVHICAEIKEERFAQYMVDAGCDDFIHLGAFRRSLLAQSLVSPGMGNVFQDLLAFSSGALLTIEPIPETMVGKTFSDLLSNFKERSNSLLIGLLENSGNPYEMKRQALHEAQKTPDISHLVSRLQEVKTLTANFPILCPPPDHLIKANTQAVILGRTNEKETMA